MISNVAGALAFVIFILAMLFAVELVWDLLRRRRLGQGVDIGRMPWGLEDRFGLRPRGSAIGLGTALVALAVALSLAFWR
jgi:hypothetical protein